MEPASPRPLRGGEQLRAPWVGAVPPAHAGRGSGPPVDGRRGFPAGEERGAAGERHHSQGRPLKPAVRSRRGEAALILDAEGGNRSPAACSQLCHWFALVTVGRSPLFPLNPS